MELFPSAEKPAAGRLDVCLLAALLTWAFALRLWYARTGLDNTRFADEFFTLANVQSFFAEGSLRPVNLFYPALSNLVHSLLLGGVDALARWTGRGGETILHDGLFTPRAYFISRTFQSGIGVLTLYWTYRIGRRLLSPRAGLLAALVLAAVPLHMRQSVVIKPDILMLLGLLIATEATVAAVASWRLRHFLGAGAAVGLAASGKYNGVAAALPLTLFALPRAWREPAVLVRLVAAGGAALLIFVLINPFFFPMLDVFRQEFSHTLQHYRDMADTSGFAPSHLGVLEATAAKMFAPNFHGLFTGLLGFAGLLAVLVRAWRRRSAGLALLAVFPLAYIVLYSLTTTWAKNNNYLPLCPFMALGAAALVCDVGRRLHGRAVTIFAVAVLLWCATLVWRPMAYAYRETVPTTLDVAESTLEERLAPRSDARILYQLGGTKDLVSISGDDGQGLVRPFDAIEQTSARDLDLTDAEIYVPAVLATPRAAARVAAARQVLRIEPRFLRTQGEPLTLVLHPYPVAGAPLAVELPRPGAGGAWTGHLPEGIHYPVLVSFEVLLAVGVEPPDEVMAGDRPLDLFPGGKRGRRWLTERVLLERSPAAITLAGLPAGVKPPSLRLFPWGGR